MIKLAEFLPSNPNILWAWARQIGIRYAICKCAPELTGLNGPWEIDALRTTQTRFYKAGFSLYGLEGDQFDMSRIKLGLPGFEEDLERYCQMLRNMGELGIPLLCYNFMAGTGWYRSAGDAPGRGGALVTRFRLSDVPKQLLECGRVTAEQIWQNYTQFIRTVMPVAEAAGVRMGMHPDDPPLCELRGVGRILSKPDNFERAMALAPSSSNGVTYCQANFQLMTDDVAGWASRLAEQGKIFFIHFRNVRGTAEDFEETFHDEAPDNMEGMLRLYGSLDLDVPLRVDHVPSMAGEDNFEPGYGAAGRLFAMGYVKGALQAHGIPYE